ncbi:MAG: hypothetical protein AAF798_16920, partial [Bacteroidota bacterium]
FEVKRLRDGALPGASDDMIAAYREDYNTLANKVSACGMILGESMKRVDAMAVAVGRLDADASNLFDQLHDLKMELMTLDEAMNGNRSKGEIGERNAPNVRSRMSVARRGLSTTYGPTPLHKESMQIAQKELASLMPKVKAIASERIPRMEEQLSNMGAPWIEGQPLPKE